MGHRVRQAVPLHVGRVCLSRRENGELSEELRPVAKRVIWFEEPEEALKYPKRFLTYLMTYRTTEDVEVARRHYNRRRLRGGARRPGAGDLLRPIVARVEHPLPSRSCSAAAQASVPRREPCKGSRQPVCTSTMRR